MKRTFIILASAIALVSCTSEIFDNVTGSNTSMDNSIEVNAMIGNSVMTRATSAVVKDTSTTATYLASFSLSAWNGSEENFKDVTFTKNNQGKFVSDNSAQYWATGNFAFVGWANNNGAQKGSEVLKNYTPASSQVSGRYVIPAYKYSSTHNIERQDDPVIAVNYTQKPEDGNTVDLAFQHLLSRISINLCAPYYQDSTVCLLDFGFNGVDTAATFTCKYPYDSGDAQSLNNTDDALPKECWTDGVSAVVGEYGDAQNELYWWEGAALINETVIPRSLSDGGKFSPAPWLNVIPGSNVADNLQIRLQYRNKAGVWAKMTTQVSLSSADIEEYTPGKQYVYNVRVLGQNEDDASIDTAKVQIVSVDVQDWNASSLTEKNSSNIGIGKGLQDLIDEIEAGTGFGTINLAEDFTLYDSVVVHTPASGKGSDITINLNGYNITAVDTLKNMFKIENGAKLTFIENGRTSGSTTVYGSIVGANQKTIFNVNEGGSLTVESGDYKFKKSGTDSTGTVISTASLATNVSVTGGTFTSGSEVSPFVVTEGTSGSVTGILTGGTYIGGYAPVPYPGTADGYTVAQGYTAINTSATSPVTWKVVINGESFSINLTQPSVTDVTAD